MSLRDRGGFGETHGPDGGFVVRYVNGKVAQWMGPYDTEQKTENARRRWRGNRLNAADRMKLGTGAIPWSDRNEESA